MTSDTYTCINCGCVVEIPAYMLPTARQRENIRRGLCRDCGSSKTEVKTP